MTLLRLFALLLLAVGALAQDEVTTEQKLATIPDGLQLAHTMTAPDGSQVTDHTRFAFGSGGAFVAYRAYRGGKSVAMLGDEELGEFDYLHDPVMDHARQHHAFRAGNRISKTKEKWWPIVDGKQGKGFDWIGQVAVGADGTPAFWVQPGAKIAKDGSYQQRAMVFYVGSKKGKKFQATRALLDPSFSRDGTVVATVGGSPQQQSAIFATAKKQTVSDNGFVAVEGFALSPDGKQIAMTIVTGGMPLPPGMPPPPGVTPGKWRVAVDGRLFGEDSDGAGAVTWSPNGKRFAFKFVTGQLMGIACDNDKQPKADYDFVGNPVFDATAASVAFVSCKGGKIDHYSRLQPWGDRALTGGRFSLHRRSVGKSKTETLSEDAEGVAWPMFGPQGQLAYALKDKGKWHVVVDDKRSAGFDEVAGLEFAADGKSLGFGARSGRELWWRVLPLQ